METPESHPNICRIFTRFRICSEGVGLARGRRSFQAFIQVRDSNQRHCRSDARPDRTVFYFVVHRIQSRLRTSAHHSTTRPPNHGQARRTRSPCSHVTMMPLSLFGSSHLCAEEEHLAFNVGKESSIYLSPRSRSSSKRLVYVLWLRLENMFIC